MSTPLRVLLVDDCEDDSVLLLRQLRRGGYAPIHKRVCTASAMQAALHEASWEIVICDYHMPGFDGLAALELLKASGVDLPFILVSGAIGEETAVEALKAGAQDYIMKQNLARLVPAIQRELREAEQRRALRQTESALRQSEEQLRQSQKMEAIGRLAAGVAHDFNNVLTTITGYSELMLRKIKGDDTLRKSAEEIQRAADKAASLTRQLLAFSRKQALQPRVIDLSGVVAEMEKMLRRLIGEDVEFATVLEENLGHVKADPGQIEQVVMNLAVNARDAMPDGGKLTIQTMNVCRREALTDQRSGVPAGDYAVLAITDTGTGMTEEVKTRIFEPFFTTKDPGKGTGLGLATCYGIIQQSGGYISVETELGRGSTFRVYLPRVEDALEPVASPPITAPSTQVLGRTILLAEDEEAVRQLASFVLREEGYNVLESTDGQEALELAGSFDGDIDLLVADAIMPRMGGRQLADCMASQRPATRVLFTSGYTNDDIVTQSDGNKFAAFLQKPFTPASLARKVREVLDRN